MLITANFKLELHGKTCEEVQEIQVIDGLDYDQIDDIIEEECHDWVHSKIESSYEWMIEDENGI